MVLLLARVLQNGRRAGDRRFSPCTKVYHAGYKFWIHFIFGTTLNVSTKETKRFLLSAYKVLCKCRICSYKCCRFSKFPGGACPRTLLDDPPVTAILSPPTMPHLGEPCISLLTDTVTAGRRMLKVPYLLTVRLIHISTK